VIAGRVSALQRLLSSSGRITKLPYSHRNVAEYRNYGVRQCFRGWLVPDLVLIKQAKQAATDTVPACVSGRGGGPIASRFPRAIEPGSGRSGARSSGCGRRMGVVPGIPASRRRTISLHYMRQNVNILDIALQQTEN
jgi:hypothetical protein